MNRWWAVLACGALAACGGDPLLRDAGARPDAGFFVPTPRDATPKDAEATPDAAALPDAGADLDATTAAPDATTAAPDATAAAPDATAAAPDADLLDATASRPDASPIDAGTPAMDAASMDASPRDAAPLDAAVVTMDAAPRPDATTPDAGGVMQGGGLMITELLPRSATLEWIEVTNTTNGAVNLANYTFSVGARTGLAIRATTDPAGSSPVNIGAGAALVGVANPPMGQPIPAIARFVIGGQGQLGADWLPDNGGAVSLVSPGGAGDVVDYSANATDPATPIGARDYPLVDEVPTQLDLAVVGPGGELGNDNGGVWCAPVFKGGTPNAANRSCGELVISELCYDYASPTGSGDDGYEYVELAGHAGGSLANTFLGFIEGTGAQAGTANGASIALTGARVPLDGLYVIADRAPSLPTSFVPNTDQVEEIGSGSSSALENGPDAIQLYRTIPGAGSVLLDALAYGAVTGTLDTQRNLPYVEGTPVADFATTAYSVSYARADDERDTNDNAADFRYAPTGTPGLRNGDSSLRVTALSQNTLLVGTSSIITFTGVNFTDSMMISASQTPSPTLSLQPITAQNQLAVRIVYPAGGSGLAQRVSFTLTARAESGRVLTLTDAFAWTSANNETSQGIECDFCNLQFPTTLTLAPGAVSQPIFGRIFEGSLTDLAVGMAAGGVLAELGYGPAGSDPRSVNWRWKRASFNVEVGNDDEYSTTLTAPTARGTYGYTYRFSLDGGLTWTYADTDGAGSNGGLSFAPASVGAMTVQ